MSRDVRVRRLCSDVVFWWWSWTAPDTSCTAWPLSPGSEWALAFRALCNSDGSEKEDIRVTSETLGPVTSFVVYPRPTGEWGGVKSSSRNEQLSIRKVSIVCSCLCIVAWIACEKEWDVRTVWNVFETHENLWRGETCKKKKSVPESNLSFLPPSWWKKNKQQALSKATHTFLIFRQRICFPWVFSPNAQDIRKHKSTFLCLFLKLRFPLQADEAHSLALKLTSPAAPANAVFRTRETFGVHSYCWFLSAVKECKSISDRIKADYF